LLRSSLRTGKKNQAPNPTNDTPLLDDAGKKCIQQVVGSFLYYARAVNPTTLMASSAIATQQSVPTKNTKKWADQFLDYRWMHPDAVVQYRASDMILNVHSNTSYLFALCAQSRTGGYFFLSSLPVDGDPIKLNGTIHIKCTILKLVAASAAETKLGALFLNAQEAKVLHLTLANLDTHSHRLQFTLTTLPPLALSTIPSNANAPVQWRCDTSGFYMEKCRSTSNFTINLGKKTLVTIPQNTIQWAYVNPRFGTNSFFEWGLPNLDFFLAPTHN
jgi:hypothetical protein